jgi:uncharacterized membrane protein
MVISTQSELGIVITLLPNQSADWAQTRLFMLLICGTTLAVGLFWTFVGAWAVLPFAGLEAALVAWFLYRVCRDTYQRQVITLRRDSLRVQFGTHFPQRSWDFDRAAAQLAATAPRHHLEGPHLQLYDSRHTIELGRFLNSDDRHTALVALKDAGLSVRHYEAGASRTL